MIAQFYCLECTKFFVQSVEKGHYAVCPHCLGKGVRIISDYNWRLEQPETPKVND